MPSRRGGPGRTTRLLGIGTAVILAFDAALLLLLWLLVHRALFGWLALACGVAAALVLVGLRLHARRLQAITRARHDLADELRSLNQFIHRR